MSTKAYNTKLSSRDSFIYANCQYLNWHVQHDSFTKDMGYSLFDVWYMRTIGIRSGHTSFPPALTTFSGKAFVLGEWVDVCKLIYTRLEQYYKQANINLNPYWNRLLNKRRRSCLLPSINILSGKQSSLQQRGALAKVKKWQILPAISVYIMAYHNATDNEFSQRSPPTNKNTNRKEKGENQK